MRPRKQRGESRYSAASTEVRDPLTTHQLRSIEHITRKRLTAAPAEGPIGRRIDREQLRDPRIEVDVVSKQPQLELGAQRQTARAQVRAEHQPGRGKVVAHVRGLARPTALPGW